VSHEIGSSMKSVGEIMSIGHSFEEVIQKGLRMIGQGMHGFVGNYNITFDDLDEALSKPTDLRIFAIADALAKGYSVERIAELTQIDRWFLERLENIHAFTKVLKEYNKIEELPLEVVREAKRLGFSDFQVARFVENPRGPMDEALIRARKHRKWLNVLPTVCRINTVASDRPDETNYLYFTYGEGVGNPVQPSTGKESVVVLGPAPTASARRWSSTGVR